MELSSYNFSAFFTAISILVSVFGLLSIGQLFLRLQLRMDWEIKVLIVFAVSSFVYVLIGENMPINIQSGLWGSFGAIYMSIVIGLYFLILWKPIRKINERKIKILDRLFVNSLLHDSKKIESLLGELPYFFNDLLTHSLTNNTAGNIIRYYLSSQIFISNFCKSGALLNQVVIFCVNNYNQNRHKIYHTTLFLKKSITESLENKDSFLVETIDESIFPNSLSFLDELLFDEKAKSLNLELWSDCPYNASYLYKKNYIKVVARYFGLIYQMEMDANKQENRKIYKIDSDIANMFFKEIEKFFEIHSNQEEKDKLMEDLRGVGSEYGHIKNHPENVQEIIGKSLYNILENFISFYETRDDESLRLNLLFLHNDFIMKFGENEDVIADNVFKKLLKNKILDDNSSNIKGFFPAMILIYFYLYGHYVFTEDINRSDLQDFHIPILQGVATSFPKLYSGFVHEFIDMESLPVNKVEKLKIKGSEIIIKFLPQNIHYNFEKNTLTYYYSGNISASVINLNKVRNENKIEITKA